MGLRRPQVIINESVLSSFVAPAGDRVAVMLGTASWGPISTVTSISSLADFISNFKDERSTDGLTLIKGADLFFRNGGTLKVIRLDDGAADYADYTAQGGAAVNMIVFQGKYKGTHGNNIAITITTNGSNRDITITDGLITEIFNNNGTGYSTNTLLAEAVNTFSSLITATVEIGQEATIVDALSETYLTGGLDGDSSIDVADYTTAFDNLLLNEDFDFLLCPGQTENSFHSTMVAKLDTRAANEKKYARFISGIAKDETISTMGARTATGKRFSLVAPNVSYTNRYSGDTEILDGSYLACAYTGKLCTLDLEESMTRKTISVDDLSINESSGTKYYTKSQQEQVLQNNCIPISNINNEIKAVRAITRIDDETSLYFEEVIVDISDFVRDELNTYYDSFIGQPNTVQTRSLIASGTDAKLITYKNLGYLTEYTATSVVEGASSDTMIAAVGYKPTRATNFIYLNIDIS